MQGDSLDLRFRSSKSMKTKDNASLRLGVAYKEEET